MREVAVSRWLSSSGIATVTALPGVDQPVEVSSRSVTFWRELPTHHQGSPAQIASTLKRLHALPVPHDLALGTLNPFIRLPERIRAAATLPVGDRVASNQAGHAGR